MPIFIGHDTALRYWLRPAARIPAGSGLRRPVTGPAAERAAVEAMIAALRPLGICPNDDGRFDLIFERDTRRSSSPLVRSRVLTVPLPARSFLPLAPGAFIARPELAFVLSARGNDLPATIMNAFALCSDKAPDENGALADRSERITDPERMRDFADAVPGLHGRKAARSVLRHVLAGSRSPMESAIACMLGLPVRVGGFELRGFELNRPVPLAPRQAAIMRTGALTPDIVFPEQRVAVEYNSRRHHDLVHQADRDGGRAAALEASGWTVRELRWPQFKDFRAFLRFVDLLRADLGLRTKRRCPRVVTRQLGLHARLKEIACVNRRAHGPAGP